MNPDVRHLIEKFEEMLTLNGRKRVFEDGQKLSTDFINQKSDPEAFTKEFLIEPVFRKFNLSKLTEKHFRGIKQDLRKVDYVLKNHKGESFLAEAKPLNSDLFDKSSDGAVNQIKGLFRLAEVQRDYEFGIATDGLKWIFIDKNSKVVFQYDLRDELDKIREILVGKEEVSSERIEEEISKKFYVWYNALLHGGKYKDHENKTGTISTKDCLVENILFVSKPEDKKQIAQTIMDRLIFIKFLQSKEIVGYDILKYLSSLEENILNEKMKQLFFSVLNTKESERVDIDPKFKGIPYLNGSLFVRTDAETRNPDYKIRAFILKKVIKFLDSFKFVHTEDVSNKKILDPEILGYIFERAMTATDRKGTGAYYTPKTITTYISKNTIHPVIVKKVNKLLKEKGYKDSELLKDIEEVYRLRESTLGEVFSKIILNLRVCDNACGSGAFLLAAADVLLKVYQRIKEELRLRNSEISMRKLILQNNLYGVDINPNAIEIAKLRLWLWLVTAYEPDKVEPLPNIDYNLRVGNSLIGYVDISKFKDHKLTLLDWYSAEKSLNILLKKREDKIKEYKTAAGDKARELKSEIDDLDKKIKKLLDINLFQEISKKTKIDEEEFRKINPFHWGFEFYDIFDGDGETDEKGFDAIIGNPPYIRIQNLKLESPAQVEIFKKIYKTASKGNYDIYVLFDERSLKLVNDVGILGYIQPHKFFQANYGEALRGIISRNKYLREIVNFMDQQVFVGATTYTCLLFLSKQEHENFRYAQIDRVVNLSNQLEQIELNKKTNIKIEIIPSTLVSSSPWSFGVGQEISILSKLKSIESNLDSVTERIFQGVRTGIDDIFVLDIRKIKGKKILGFSKALKKDVEVELGITFPLVKGEQMLRYSIDDAKKRIIVPYYVDEKYHLIKESEMKLKYPLCWEYLKENKEILEKRERGKIAKIGWWGFSRTQNIDIIRRQKILTADLANHNSFSLDETGEIHFTSGYGIIPKKDYPIKLLLTILNSKLLEWYLRKISTTFRGGYYSCEYRFIKNLPIIEANKIENNIKNKLISLCEKALNGDKKSESEIDMLIYRIYGITNEEQKIIEESLK
ncbi:MAG: Eco57I restriction-modification methylase domain-containing protein [Candidatus Aenigmarchaeota archaeon]|nr:Eco57I restriction-modification methylase domain-containing protein [Candidatus Aenigmarchaeota archaeon]